MLDSIEVRWQFIIRYSGHTIERFDINIHYVVNWPQLTCTSITTQLQYLNVAIYITNNNDVGANSS